MLTARSEPEEIVIEGHPGQQRLLDDRSHDILGLVSGFGYGKTNFGARWMYDRCLINAASKYSLIVAPDFRLLTDVCFEAYHEHLTTCGLRESFDYKIRTSKKSIEHYWGHTIIGVTAEKPKKIAAYNASHAWVDEAARCAIEVHEQLAGRVRCPKAKLLQKLYTTTPEGINWLAELFSTKDFITDGAHQISPHIMYLRGSSYDNPYLPKAYLEALERTYGTDSEMFQAYVRGLFVSLSKKRFYFNFTPSCEVDAEFNPTIRRFGLAFDFNVDQTTWAVVQQNPTHQGGYIVIRDNGSNARGVEEACQQFILAFPPSEYRDCRISVGGDAAGWARSPLSHLTGYQIIETLLRPFYPLLSIDAPHANPFVTERRFNTNRLFKTRDLLVSRVCSAVIQSARIAESDGERGIKKGSDDTVTHAMEAVDNMMLLLAPPPTKLQRAYGTSY